MTTKEVFDEIQQRINQKNSAQLVDSQGVYQFLLTGTDAAEY